MKQVASAVGLQLLRHGCEEVRLDSNDDFNWVLVVAFVALCVCLFVCFMFVVCLFVCEAMLDQRIKVVDSLVSCGSGPKFNSGIVTSRF